MMLMLSKTGLGSWAHMNLRRSESQGERSRFSHHCSGGYSSSAFRAPLPPPLPSQKHGT